MYCRLSPRSIITIHLKKYNMLFANVLLDKRDID